MKKQKTENKKYHAKDVACEMSVECDCFWQWCDLTFYFRQFQIPKQWR